MLSYTEARGLYSKFTNNDGSTNLTLGDTLLNENIRKVLGAVSWPFLEYERTYTTVADQQFYDLPADLDKLIDVTITVGTIIYRPLQVASWDDWREYNSTTGVTSDNPSYFFVKTGADGPQVGFWPIPATSGNTITIVYQKLYRDMTKSDYEVGTITTVTNGGTTITGSGSSWDASMAGRWIRIDYGGANSGDGIWYQIESVTSATELELSRPYLGTAIAAGSATYTIGDVMPIPEKYQMLPIYGAANDYWMMESDPSRADRFLNMYDTLMQQMKDEEGKKTTSPVLDVYENTPYINPNLNPTVT
jgi:hypothetical protein